MTPMTKVTCALSGCKKSPASERAKYCCEQHRWDAYNAKRRGQGTRLVVQSGRTTPKGTRPPTKPKRQPFVVRLPKEGQVVHHIVIPDTQCAPGTPTAHLRWIGEYIKGRIESWGPDVLVRVIHLGDHWDMPSLSSYDKKGGREMEGRRYWDDIRYANEGWRLWTEPWLGKYPNVEAHFIMGNHENRIERVISGDAQMEGLVSLDHIETPGFIRHDFKTLVWLDGVCYTHYFYNKNTGRPYAGENLHTRLKTIGHSFTMGHQQWYDHAVRYVDTPDGARGQMGLVAGACYLHDEDYKGPQGNSHWRGIVVCHDVHDGEYSIMPVDFRRLCREYENGMDIDDFKASIGLE